MKEFLKGKKTYIVAAVIVIYAVVMAWDGKLSMTEAFWMAMNGLGFGALRDAIK